MRLVPAVGLWLTLAVASLTAGPAIAQSWSPAVDLSPAIDDSSAPQVATDSAGNTTVVWQQDDGSFEIIRSSRFSGGVWEVPLNVSEVGQEDTRNPDVTVDEAGVATAVWEHDDGSGYRIEASRLIGGVWTTPVAISSVFEAVDAKVVVDPSGVVTAIWAATTAMGDRVIQAARFSGGTWASALDVSVIDAFDKQDVQLAVDSAGFVTAVWRQQDGANDRVFASRLTGATWTTPVILSEAGEDARRPQVTVDAMGIATAIWQRQETSTSENVIEAARFSGGLWTATPDVTSIALNDQTDPQVVVDGTGTVTAVWRGQIVPMGDSVIQSSRYIAGAWNAPITVSPAGQSIDDRPALTIDTAGIPIVIWPASEGIGDVRIFASRFDGSAWSPAVGISLDGGAANEPQVTSDGSDIVTAVWTRNDGAWEITQVSRFGDPASVAVVPTLTEWAIILLTLMLAGVGAVRVGQGRRRPLP